MADGRETFENGPRLPPAWIGGITGTGAAKWTVIADSTAPAGPGVLHQSGEATYSWAVKKDEALQDGFVEVLFKPVDGKEDQAAGLIWRFKDANNYYIVRANALENNVVLYKTANGRRTSLAVKGRSFGYGVDAPVPTGKWSRLRVDFNGNLFVVSYRGRELFRVEDGTFKDAGAVGVWTKADSVTSFDDFSCGSIRSGSGSATK